MSQHHERRKDPRVETRFRVRKIHHAGAKPEAVSDYCQTRNISRNGAYCVCTRYFPEFSRLRITLELQEPGSDYKEDVECEGVVVRSEGKMIIEGKEMYAFAVFFDRISEEARRKLGDYAEKHRASTKPAGPSSGGAGEKT